MYLIVSNFICRHSTPSEGSASAVPSTPSDGSASAVSLDLSQQTITSQ